MERKPSIRITIAGSGGSNGVPIIACDCAVCTSGDVHDKRMRASAFVTDGEKTIAIDTGPEFRMQALAYKLKRLDAVLLTHAHADHIHGLDDVRMFSKTAPLAVYSDANTLKEVRHNFDYVYRRTQIGGGKPQLKLVDSCAFTPEKPLAIGGMKIVPVPMLHGKLPTTGWRINGFAYLTDLSFLPQSSFALIEGIEALVIDGLRVKKSETHFTFAEALAVAAQTSAKRVYLTHITHEHSHEQIKRLLLEAQRANDNLKGRIIEPAFDGLVLEVN